jgi:hypothetical protein
MFVHLIFIISDTDYYWNEYYQAFTEFNLTSIFVLKKLQKPQMMLTIQFRIIHYKVTDTLFI